MRQLTRFALFLPFLSTLGCVPASKSLPPAALDVLRNADTYELLALESADKQKAGAELFHGYAVRGKCAMPAKKDRDWLTANIERGLVDQPKPRQFRSPQVHGVRARRGDEPTDLLFEFDANKVTVFWEDTNRVYPTSDLPWWMIQKHLFDAGVRDPE